MGAVFFAVLAVDAQRDRNDDMRTRLAGYLSPHDIALPEPPRHRLDLTVDLYNARR